MKETHDLYLDLMKKCLTNWIYLETEMKKIRGGNLWKRSLIRVLNARGLQIAMSIPMNPDIRATGCDWPPTAHTMIGLRRLDNIQFCVEDVLSKNIPGDLIECGVWRGGVTIFMRAILKAHNINDRIVYVADSFQGCPKPNAEKYPQDKQNMLYTSKELAIPLEEVKANFASYGLLDEQVRFLKGWFKDTLLDAPFEKLAVLRLDGDLYESTMDVLANLYSKLSIGGYLIVDDFGALGPSRQAVLDYRKANGINDKIIKVDCSGVYWQKSK